MDAKVYELINDQINKELYSAYLYLSFADYYEEEGLSGYANYFEIQAQEERDHAMIFRNYLHENGEAVKLLAIDMPDKTFANFLEPLEAEHRAKERRLAGAARPEHGDELAGLQLEVEPAPQLVAATRKRGGHDAKRWCRAHEPSAVLI